MKSWMWNVARMCIGMSMGRLVQSTMKTPTRMTTMAETKKNLSRLVMIWSNYEKLTKV